MNKIINIDKDILKKEFFANLLESLEKLKIPPPTSTPFGKGRKTLDKIMIGLSGGNSLKIFYEEIKDKFWLIDKKLREKIYFCFLDERVVSFEDNDSNYKLCKNLFLDSLVENGLLKKENILLPDFSLDNYSFYYFKKVQKIDIGLFGVGEDGHTCSLFPNHILLEDNSYSYLKIEDSPKPPLNRITISKSMLKDIDYSFVFFIGEGKKTALNNFLDESIDYKNCPAKLILSCKNNFLVSDIY